MDLIPHSFKVNTNYEEPIYASLGRGYGLPEYHLKKAIYLHTDAIRMNMGAIHYVF